MVAAMAGAGSAVVWAMVGSAASAGFGNDFDVNTIDKFEATADIVMRHGPIPAGDVRAFDARKVVDTIGPTVILPGQQHR